MKQGIIGAVVVLVLELIVGLIIVYGGVINVAADDPPGGLHRWLMHSAMDASVEGRAEKIKIPDLTKIDLNKGAWHYNRMCGGCHGKPGDKPHKHAISPPPPNLVKRHHTDEVAEDFWITKHGIMMTGMPAWGQYHDDDDLWAIVAFMQKLPKLSEEQYKAMVAKGDEHNGDEHHHDADDDDDDHKKTAPAAAKNGTNGATNGAATDKGAATNKGAVTTK